MFTFKTCRFAAYAAALLLGLQQSAAGQSAPRNTSVFVNYVYTASLGFGGYSLGGLTANVYALPLSHTFTDMPIDGWSVKLLLPVQFGIYNFKATIDGRDISINQQSLSFVPGAELHIPLTNNFALKPFAQFGAGHTFGAGGTNPDAWIYLAGVRSIAEWHDGEYTFSLGNGVVFAGDQPIGSGFTERYVSLQAAGEVRRPIGFKIADWRPDIGLYAAEYYYPSPLSFSRYLNNPLRVANQNEIGFSVGSADPLKLLWLSNPRIGAGVVFGGGLTVYHVNFGFPF